MNSSSSTIINTKNNPSTCHCENDTIICLNVNGVEFYKSWGNLTIGRSRYNDVVINDQSVSKFHGNIEISKVGVSVTDKNSSNFTFVNGVKNSIYQRRSVVNGSVIKFGDVECTITFVDEWKQLETSTLIDSNIQAGSTPEKMQSINIESKQGDIEGLVQVDKSIMSKNKENPKLARLCVRPKINNKILSGILVAYSDGIRYTSMSNHIVDILYDNIKNAFFQYTDEKMMILVHFHLKHAVNFGKKKYYNIQFYRDIEEIITELGKNQLKTHFESFCDKVEMLSSEQIIFQTPYSNLEFYGKHYKSIVALQPTKSCLVNLTNWPPFVLSVEDVVHLHLECVQSGLKNINMIIFIEGYYEKVLKIDSIPVDHYPRVLGWLKASSIRFSKGVKTCDWEVIIKSISDDFKGFFESGGWKSFNPERYCRNKKEGDDEEEEKKGDKEVEQEIDNTYTAAAATAEEDNEKNNNPTVAVDSYPTEKNQSKRDSPSTTKTCHNLYTEKLKSLPSSSSLLSSSSPKFKAPAVPEISGHHANPFLDTENTIKLQSSDNVVIEIDIMAAKMSTTIKEMLHLSNYDEDIEIVFPFPSIKGVILKKIVEWVEQHKNDPPPPEDDVNHQKSIDDISEWDMEFLNVDQETFYAIISAARFLDIKGLKNVCCRKFGMLLRDKTHEKIVSYR